MTETSDALDLPLEPVPNCRLIKGVLFAPGVKFRQLLVTGPPGCGKTTLINRIGGWPEEGYIDLTVKGWWKVHHLTLRPREIHLGLPFVGRDEALALFEPEWLSGSEHLRLDFDRIQLPPPKRFFWDVNWHARFVFEFLLPAPTTIYRQRRERARRGTHPVDEQLDLDQVRRQVGAFAQTALHFHRQGMVVFIRQHLDAAPFRITDEVTDAEHGRPD